MPVQSEDGVFEVVVRQIAYRIGDTHRLLDRPDRVRIDSHVVLGERGRQRAKGLDLVVGRKDAGLELVRPEAEAALQLRRVVDELLDRSHLAAARRRVRVSEEAVGREGHTVAQPAAEDLRDRDAPGLPEDVEARELERREHLRAPVVERRRRVGDRERHLREARRVVADQQRLDGTEHGLGRLAAAAHLAETNEPVVGLDLDDRPDEPSPVAAVGVAKRRLDRNRHGRRSDVDNLHGRRE